MWLGAPWRQGRGSPKCARGDLISQAFPARRCHEVQAQTHAAGTRAQFLASQLWPKSHTVLPMLGQVWPNPGQAWSIPSKVWSELAEVERNLVDPEPCAWPKLAGVSHNIGRSRRSLTIGPYAKHTSSASTTSSSPCAYRCPVRSSRRVARASAWARADGPMRGFFRTHACEGPRLASPTPPPSRIDARLLTSARRSRACSSGVL